MPASPSLAGVIHQPFGQQIEFFRRKLNLPTEHWEDIKKAAHDRAFVVAGATKADLLADLRAAVDKANIGNTLETFRRDFREAVAKHGWTGWTGEGTPGGEAWRTRVIYETNLRTSYAAGRWQQLNDPALLAERPYWRYVHSDLVARPRLLHAHWGDMGLTLPHDHPFWQTHYPPNGWGCRCYVEAVREPAEGDATEPPEGWDTEGEATGAPPGIDKGWDYAPGANADGNLSDFAARKAGSLPAQLADAFAQDVAEVLTQQLSLDDFLDAGRAISKTLPNGGKNPAAFEAALLRSLGSVGISTPARVSSATAAARTVRDASARFPDTWTAAADALGPLHVRAAGRSRAWAWTADRTGAARLPAFGMVSASAGEGYMTVRAGDLSVAVHEYAHRLQSALPKLDALFQEMHRRRTAGEELLSLRSLTGAGYGASEKTRKDRYVDAYWGKEYAGRGALEVMTMAFQSVLGGDMDELQTLYAKDRKMVDFVVGLLHKWKP